MIEEKTRYTGLNKTSVSICVASGKLPFQSAPKDDRHLADLHLALYNDVVVFDQATKIIYAISWVHLGQEVRAYRGREPSG